MILINLEIKALDHLAASVGAADLKFDVVTLTTLPEQKVVAAGAKYKAQCFYLLVLLLSFQL